MQEISRDIYYETAYSGVTLGAILLPMGTVMIDAPLRAEDGRAWRAALNYLGGNSNRLLINLDAHPDRTLGSRVMDCTIIAHQKTAQVFRGRPSVFKGQNAESGSEWETYDEAVGTRWALPDLTFTQELNLYWGPPDLLLEHRPGPTPGAIWVTIPAAKVVFVGDAVLADQPPFLTHADIPAWLEALDVLLANYEGYAIVSGRDGLVSRDIVLTLKKHLSHILQTLEQAAKADISPEATENLIPALLTNLKVPPQIEDQYAQRLRHGLAQYYARHYRATELPNE
jgi:glyoxylase-like metal-dependent hydrolase (beta-lactamase superfamily II)